MQGKKTVVRIVSGCTALMVVLVYAAYSNYRVDTQRIALPAVKRSESLFHSRHLLLDTSSGRDYDEEDTIRETSSSTCSNGANGNDVDNANCSKPLQHGNESCQFVLDQCSDDVALFNYLAFVACDLPSVKVWVWSVCGCGHIRNLSILL